MSATESLSVFLAGNPNSGKSTLFNVLTGSRQKVGNYSGVTVERKEGATVAPSGRKVSVVDLPGAYSLNAHSPDEIITRDVIHRLKDGDQSNEVVVAVVDVNQLERQLSLVLELTEVKVPVVLALNMMDLASKRKLKIDIPALAEHLGVPVVPISARNREGINELLEKLEALSSLPESSHSASSISSPQSPQERYQRVDSILRAVVLHHPVGLNWTDRLDKVLLHRFFGPWILLCIFALVFQAVFSWAELPMEWIESGTELVGAWVSRLVPDGPLQSLLVDGVVAGFGGVIIFLPQILLLFFFILLLEESGYMARAAFLMDRLMGSVGLHGRAFIPLLSSFACAVPGIMATRSIENQRARLATILVAPLMACSARLPVYSLVIAAFIPNLALFGPVRLQGVVMLGLYLLGIVFALLIAFILRKTSLKGERPALLMEMPQYQIPDLRNVMIGLLTRAKIFIRQVGKIIFTMTILLWALASYPKAPLNADRPAIEYSYAGRLGKMIEPVLQPIGFDWKIGVALIPGFAAREVMVSALATVYAIDDGDENEMTRSLKERVVSDYSVATGLALLVWYVFSPQCISTLAVTRRETGSWKWPGFMLAYMLALAYFGALIVFQGFRFFGG